MICVHAHIHTYVFVLIPCGVQSTYVCHEYFLCTYVHTYIRTYINDVYVHMYIQDVYNSNNMY